MAGHPPDNPSAHPGDAGAGAPRPDPRSAPPPNDGHRSSGQLSRAESRSVTILCAIYALRILGMNLVLPVLAPYAGSLRGASTLLAGLAIGAYGLTQAALQIPFGVLSDRIGRKRAIVLGLAFFTLGSVVAATADSIVGLIAGRMIQGMGAVASVVVALTADLTRAEVRTQAMARVGVWVGASFALGMSAGPFLAKWFGVPMLFWTTAVSAAIAALGLWVVVPEPPRHSRGRRLDRAEVRFLLRQGPLSVLVSGTFLLHLALTGVFVILPLLYHQRYGPGEIWRLVVPVVVLGLGAMALIGQFAGRGGKSRDILLVGGILYVAACVLFSASSDSLRGTFVALCVLVLGVACLEPVLPSLMTRWSPPEHRGAAAGVFHMSQFLGSFFGGLCGGAFSGERTSVFFAVLGAVVALWLGFAWWVTRGGVPDAGDRRTG